MTTIIERLGAALSDRYRVERELGAGGMATVYLAHDLRHEREVAIKVLHPDLGAALGAERFLTEIKTTARLQHPHILPLLDSGAADGLLYYVMPLVRGETLRARLERERQLPVDDAVRIASEVAGALDHAHKQGIIHRDIKPENILVQDGHALVADFGIALALQQAGGQRITQTGLSLGTPAYMSPEQASADRTLDARSDQYALAAVLFEMLDGEAPFTGTTAAATIARLMIERPRRVDERRPAVPAGVANAVQRALEKLPADRFATCAAFAEALKDTSPASARIAAPGAAAGGSRRWLVATGAAVAALAIGWLAGQRGTSAAERPNAPASRLALLVPSGHSIARSMLAPVLGISADGREIFYHAISPGRSDSRIYRQPIDADSATAVPNSEGLTNPTASLDGRWLAAINRADGLVLLPLNGESGDLRPVVPGPSVKMAWHTDGNLYLSQGDYRKVERVDPRSRTVTTVVRVPDPGVWIQQVLPDGAHALVIVAGIAISQGRPALLDLKSGKIEMLLNEELSNVSYSGGLFVGRRGDGSLLAWDLDASGRKPIGPSVLLATSLATVGRTGESQFDISLNGTAVYGRQPLSQLVMVDRSGKESAVVDEHDQWHNPRFSPDGARLLLDRTNADGRNVWIVELATRALSRATVARNGHDALWSPDGRSFLFLTDESGPIGLRRVSSSGSAAVAESLLTRGDVGAPNGFLPDGSPVISNASAGATGMDLAVVRNRGAGPIEPLLTAKGNQTSATVSNDGNWLAYTDDVTGREELYVRRTSDGQPVQVSMEGGGEAAWSPDGRLLYYRAETPNGPTMVVAAFDPTTGAVGTRTALFAMDRYIPSSPHRNYDVSADGRRFAFVRGFDVNEVVVLQNVRALFEARRKTGATK